MPAGLVRDVWPRLVVFNLGLGALAIPVVWGVGYVLRNSVLDWWGVADRNPTENDGLVPILIVLAPFALLVGALWWAVNTRAFRRRDAGTWCLAVVASLCPSLVLFSVLPL